MYQLYFILIFFFFVFEGIRGEELFEKCTAQLKL